jgi:hypothetical protein
MDMRISGDEFKGLEHFTSVQEAEEFITKHKALGGKVKKVVKHENFMGERMPVSPPSIRVYYRFD